MKLGKYFMLSEMTVTNTGLVNNPQRMELHNLHLLVENVLDPLREMYGKPIKVNSGYRSPLVNKKVGGAVDKNGRPTSEHVKGMAADITGGSVAENKKLFELIRDNFTFRQLIWEKGGAWVHVSYNVSDNKKQILEIK